MFPESKAHLWKGTQAAADAVTAEYGILNSLATGSGLAGSLRLRTYRARGSNDVVGHQLDVWAKTNQTDRGSNPLYGWVLEADPDTAQHILLQNPELMERALLNARASGWQRFWENYTDVWNAR